MRPKLELSAVTSFAFVRNPYDRIVSFYFYYCKSDTADGRLPNLNKSFDEYVHHICCASNGRRVNHSKCAFTDAKGKPLPAALPINQHCWIYDGNGKRVIDYIGRFENIEHDFRHITKLILDEQLQLPHLKWNKKKEHYIAPIMMMNYNK